jgi:hypothetical protein
VLIGLLTDLRWTEAKTARFGSVVPVDADLELAQTPMINTLRSALRRSAHVLGPIDPPAALGATLAGQLHGVAGLEAILDTYRYAQLQTPKRNRAPCWGRAPSGA